MKKTHFERAIFLSWHCSKRDCAFCYLSSKPEISSDPVKDRRSLASIFAEAIICRACNWKIEFLSAGCSTFKDEELLFIIRNVYKITSQKQWLNLGILDEKQLKLFKPYIEGVCGTVECITPKLRDKLCPSKPLHEIGSMFKAADKLGLKKTITIILGLGEKLEDFSHLENFIKKHDIQRITFYRLKPQKGTIFEDSKGPKTGYYVKWIKKAKKAFPKIDIVAGSWLTHLDELHLLLEAGASSFTKFPSIRKFNTKYARLIEDEVKKAGMKLEGTLTKVPKIDIIRELDKLELSSRLKDDMAIKLNQYIKRMKFNS
ncbi:radical SAM protein [Candidatus Woesearchaeota archaeon]|nr:radical SAM protein [Candidatus Woesearchaeota archaeon]